MTHYKLYSLHQGCGESLATQYHVTQVLIDEKKTTARKFVERKANTPTGQKRK